MSRTPHENLIAVLEHYREGLRIERDARNNADARVIYDAMVTDAEAALDYARDAVLAILTAEQPGAVADGEARKLYVSWVDSQSIHCNRFPSWQELSEQQKQEWRDKANPSPFPPRLQRAINQVNTTHPADEAGKGEAVAQWQARIKDSEDPWLNVGGASSHKLIEYRALYTTPTEPAPDREDAERYRWLKARLMSASFEDDDCVGLTFDLPAGSTVWACTDRTIDAAMNAARQEPA